MLEREGPGQTAFPPRISLFLVETTHFLLLHSFVHALGQNPADTLVRFLDSDCSSLDIKAVATNKVPD